MGHGLKISRGDKEMEHNDNVDKKWNKYPDQAETRKKFPGFNDKQIETLKTHVSNEVQKVRDDISTLQSNVSTMKTDISDIKTTLTSMVQTLKDIKDK